MRPGARQAATREVLQAEVLEVLRREVPAAVVLLARAAAAAAIARVGQAEAELVGPVAPAVVVADRSER
jgi:hypothetical protein